MPQAPAQVPTRRSSPASTVIKKTSTKSAAQSTVKAAKAPAAARVTTGPRRIAVIGGGMAGIACARTLVQAGHQVAVFEKNEAVGGRMATQTSSFGSFDHGAQYFTVRDERFALALQTTPGLCKPWSANAVRVLDAVGQVASAALPNREPHWVPVPGMASLVRQWSLPLVHAHNSEASLTLNTTVTRIEPDALDSGRWQLRTESTTGTASAPNTPNTANPSNTPNTDSTACVHSGFDAVLLALPAAPAAALLTASQIAAKLASQIGNVDVAPCWTLMVAYPHASQPGVPHLGPQWNAARSTHHRAAWLARESSKPGRDRIERWTLQASAAWSQEHLNDDSARVQGKLLKAFAEITGIRATPAHAETHRWLHAQTLKPLGRSHLWDANAQIGVAGDWCIGHRVEDAFVSGLELALAVHG